MKHVVLPTGLYMTHVIQPTFPFDLVSHAYPITKLYELISYCLINSANLLPSDLKSNTVALITWYRILAPLLVSIVDRRAALVTYF